MLVGVALLRLLQETIARPIELPAFVRGQTANPGLRDLIENRIDRSIDIIRLNRTLRVLLLHNVEFGSWPGQVFEFIPPNQLRPGATQLDEYERSGNAGPDDGQIGPCVIGD